MEAGSIASFSLVCAIIKTSTPWRESGLLELEAVKQPLVFFRPQPFNLPDVGQVHLKLVKDTLHAFGRILY